ncbi:holin [Ornithinibacillus massiliensis]|uniref:Holin n=1 Tax=Ornithinibacillus massiliensis TaxID=1944633 RepID=A0ABS5MC91_9BACI|nr:BhlA/UviB family holin-like peptide [Ornithinibacillus massiliensis]MBS3679951.1 holin [Ornithinibacillus massiliensis]
MDILSQVPFDMLLSQGIFAILFIWLFLDSRKDSKTREDRLMAHVEKTTDTLDTLSQRMENVSVKVDNIDNRLTQFEREVKGE